MPTLDVALINLATLPSKPSIIAAKVIAIIDNSNFASKANFIELSPIHTPIMVRIFGNKARAFFSGTILILLCKFIFIIKF